MTESQLKHWHAINSTEILNIIHACQLKLVNNPPNNHKCKSVTIEPRLTLIKQYHLCVVSRVWKGTRTDLLGTVPNHGGRREDYPTTAIAGPSKLETVAPHLPHLRVDCSNRECTRRLLANPNILGS